jgi:HK97 family phage portal protein
VAFWNRKETRSASTLRFPHDWLTDTWGGTPASAGTRVNVTSALGVSAVWSAVSLIADQVGQLPLKVYRAVGDGEREDARSHRAWRMLHDRPNSQTPAGRFWSTVSANLLLYGNCFLLKSRDEAGVVDELWVLPPAEVTVKWWPRLRQKTFVHRPAGQVSTGAQYQDGEQQREYDDEDVLHIFAMSLDGIIGLSPIDYWKQSIGTALARDEFEGEFYRNGAVLSGALHMKNSVRGPEALQRIKSSIKALFTGYGRRHEVAVFEDGAEWKTLGSPLKDLQFVESQQMTRSEVANLFHLPPNYLGASSGDSLTYATVESNSIQLAQMCIAPLCKTITDALSQDPSIMPQTIHWAEFVLEGMLRGDTGSRAEFYKALYEMKAILPDEIRKRENLPPLTAAQKRELSPPPPPQLQLDVDPPANNGNGAGSPPVNGNGNGNGAMPAIQRS